ncbi:hypothetical protein VOLCADRAFT_95762 [Volvox carteri f. nagariensis]|uniref:Uncharacterized protein n=1 Tax=Volvox carteri f. nagariensis TaxID=3068 RepID=D8U8B5_VOLCA|nr:uncharacterized protein VOLCADRAFT_95762 [Volvox carteri f. nagariensis]EFJ44061.1 hypothetical protein VOLCADRAFT_95762 [Volvox carteri f. nagariensis]|eukprot:XP_002954862.1 hypothetical protein VOLCADRAFT_95762 [Volvox carteri f. nagariensis]
MQQFPGPAGGAGGNGASLLHSALYGARSGSGSMHSGTALYRNFNAAPRDKGILAAAVSDAFMSPEDEPVSIAAAVDPMAIDAARYNAAAAALIGDKAGGSRADGTHRLNLGVVNLAAAAAAAGPDGSTQAALAHLQQHQQQQQPASKAALYGNYQARAPLAPSNGLATSLYGNSRAAPAAAAAASTGGDAAGVQGLHRYNAAQLHQLSVVRQIQLRQQAATAAKQQQQQQVHSQSMAQTKAEQQAQVLAAAAEVAQQVAARNAAAAAEQQRQTQQLQARSAAEKRLLASAAPGDASVNAAAAAAAASESAAAAAANHSTLYKRASMATDATPTILYKRPALGGGAAVAAATAPPAQTDSTATAQAAAAARAPVSALYGAYCADRQAASAAASAVASEMLQRLGHSAAAAVAVPPSRAAHEAAAQSAQSSQSVQLMAVSPAHEEDSRTPGDSSHCSETAFLDCHEDLSDDTGMSDGFGTDVSGGSSAKMFSGAKRYIHMTAAAAATKTVTRPYGLAYFPTVYSDVSSPHALALANDVMTRIRLPGGIRFMPVSSDSMLYYNGVHWGFSAFALALGSSYFQRLVEITPTLNAAVRHAPPFAAYAAYMRDGGGVAQTKQQQQQEEYLHKDGLRSILFTCAYLATKVVDRMPHTDMLRRMLSMLYNVPVSREEAHSVELKCLEGLGYRLGPYFVHNMLDDEPPCCDVY